MLVVVAYIPREPVKHAVVRVRLLCGIEVWEDIVLGDEVPGARVQPARQEDAQDKVEERFVTPEVEDEHVKSDLGGPVGEVCGREVLRLDEHGSQRIGQDLATRPDRLAHWSADHAPLKARWDVCVDAINPLPFVVFEVVAPERDAVGYANRPVRNHRKITVVFRLLEEEVVRKLMDGQEQCLRDRCTEDVGNAKVGGPTQLLCSP
mmetsp:Transcript_78419/g.155867  ORF Transcript_78419/g.155867 Transcript_78419/m.155867 type:complete len:206 (-) Transcript_78419:279-896(-)